MKKILIILFSEPEFGGLYQYSMALTEAIISNKNFDITIETNNYDIYQKYKNKTKVIFHKKLLKKFFQYLFEIKFLKIIAYRILIKSKNILKKIFSFLIKSNIKNENLYDIIIYPSQNFIYENNNKSFKIVSVIHDLMHIYEGHFSEYSFEEKSMRNYLFSNICKNSDIIVSDSKVGKKHIIESYGVNKESKIFPIYFCAFDHKEDQNYFEKLKKKYGENYFQNYFFYPAQFWEHKNHLRILDAIYYLKLKNINFNLVLTGSKKNNYKNVMKKIYEYNLSKNVINLGYVNEGAIKPLYKNSIGLIYPSLIGPTNIPPLEAMNYECPVICSDIYAMREQLKDAAFFVNPLSVKEIADAMVKISKNHKLREKLIENGKSLIKERSFENFKNKYNYLIERL